jgi:peptidyl-prolyl cis-trans isomerase B (cyclophilin B)
LPAILAGGGSALPMQRQPAIHKRLKEGILRKILVITAVIILLAGAGDVWAVSPRVQLDTSMGIIVLELSPHRAPKTVENFLQYVNDGFYDDTIFHRVIKDFMIQGGGLTADMQRKIARPPIDNEADNGLKNRVGSIAMARTGDPHSATAQFFINTKDNPNLDHQQKSAQGWGYCVFGRVVKGMEVVSAIEAVKTGSKGGYRDVPVKPVLIRKATVIMP